MPGLPYSVALTLLRAAPDPRVRPGLLRDLKAAARVRSPHFATPLDVIDEDGAFGIATELVRGRPLVSVSPLREVALLDAGLALARAFTHLHTSTSELVARRPLHGCLRPTSLLLDEHGRLVITDLGLQRLSAGAAAGYLLDDEGDDPRQDLFSIGSVLYALVVEAPPFGASSVQATRVEERLADPSFLAPLDVALPGLAEVVRRCLHRRAEDRFATTSDLTSALTSLAPEVHGGRPLLALGRPLQSSPSVTASNRSADPRQARPTAAPRPAVVRAEWLDSSVQRLRAGSRFLFVDGPSGGGRSAFVAELARRLTKDHPSGVRWADVSQCATAEDLVCCVADTLACEPDPTGRAARLGRILARRGKCLLVLDGGELLLHVAPAVISGWLAAAPELTIVCTGTTPPPGVERVHLAPLTPPDAEALWVSGRGHRPEDDPADVRRINELVEGRLLAIELLARCPDLAPAVVVRRLRDRLGLLPADEPDRGLRAALDVVSDTLPPWARATIAQLGSFSGAFGVAQSAGVVDLSAWPESSFPPAAVLLLEERRLLYRDRPRDPGGDVLVPPRPVRWRMHDAVRRWATARTTHLDLELTRLRHRLSHAELGHADVQRVLRTGVPGWRRTDLTAELGDLEAAVRSAIGDEDGTVAARCYRALLAVAGEHLPAARQWEVGRGVSELDLTDAERVAVEEGVSVAAAALGRHAEHLSRHQNALVAAADANDREAEILLALGWDPSELSSALRQARRLGDPVLVARIAVRLGEVTAPTGRPGEARQLFEEALSWADRGPDPETAARAAHQLGRLLTDNRDPEAAIASLGTAIAAWHQLGEPARGAPVEADLGGLLLDVGRPDSSLRHLVSAATAFRIEGNAAAEAAALTRLGEVSHWCGRFDGALRHLDDAQRLQRRAEDRDGLARTLGVLGLVHTETGRLRDARDMFEEALALGTTRHRSELELGRLGVSLAEGKAELARETLLRCLGDGRASNDPQLTGRSLWLLGRASFREGHPDTARTQLEGAVTQLSGRALGWRSLAELDLANVLDAQGEGTVALDVLERTIASVQAAGFVPAFALALCTRARLHLRNARAADAAADVREARSAAKGFQLGARAPLARALQALEHA
jgi:tetratricopeptide (TPR) repeat protein